MTFDGGRSWLPSLFMSCAAFTEQEMSSRYAFYAMPGPNFTVVANFREYRLAYRLAC